MNNSAEIISTETEVVTYVMEDGILHMTIKETLPTKENLTRSLEPIRSYYKEGKKLLILLDPTEGIAPNNEQRELIVHSLTDVVKAKAVVNKNLLTSVVVNFMIRIENALFPMKMFKSTEKAIEWLNTFK